jgi:hypothetical protein
VTAVPATKVDFKHTFKELYAPGREPAIVEVPEFSFLMIDGHGDPNVAPEFGQAIEALYSVSYTLKFALKRGREQLDYKVMPLEGLWWTADMATFSTERKSEWEWTLMIMQPDEVDERLFEEALSQATAKKDLPAAPRLRLERFEEGMAAQVMHVGPYDLEGPTIAQLHAFIAEHGCEPAGKHHEIYLSDPRRAAPEKLKTVLRQPILSATG